MSELTCKHCYHAHMFNPRPDEVARYGEDVMGCKRSGFEGYTRSTETCEAFYILAASKEPEK